jgi:hypothetical protein
MINAANIDPCVKSLDVPTNASRTTDKNELSAGSADGCKESNDIRKPFLENSARSVRAG